MPLVSRYVYYISRDWLQLCLKELSDACNEEFAY